MPFHHLFPDPAAAVVWDGRTDPPPLFPEELVAVSNATPFRRREFAIGRWCARRALAECGFSQTVIPALPNRLPRWPIGATGSITHCDGFVGAVVAQHTALDSIGFDAEPAEPLPSEILGLVCTVNELSWIEAQPYSHDIYWEKLIFSAKESVYKCLSPLGSGPLEFLDVVLEIDPKTRSFTARRASMNSASHELLGRIVGRFELSKRFILTSAFIEKSPVAHVSEANPSAGVPW
ncbi:MAG: 4'-phosphopantetheinyl transferase superfamily protein [Gemmatimonadaceae bacterium]